MKTSEDANMSSACTFAPQTNKSSGLPQGILPPSVPFAARNARWSEDKKRKIEQIKEQRKEREETELAKIEQRERRVSAKESIEFYNKNMRWAQNAQMKAVKKFAQVIPAAKREGVIIRNKAKKGENGSSIMSVEEKITTMVEY